LSEDNCDPYSDFIRMIFIHTFLKTANSRPARAAVDLRETCRHFRRYKYDLFTVGWDAYLRGTRKFLSIFAVFLDIADNVFLRSYCSVPTL